MKAHTLKRYCISIFTCMLQNKAMYFYKVILFNKTQRNKRCMMDTSGLCAYFKCLSHGLCDVSCSFYVVCDFISSAKTSALLKCIVRCGICTEKLQQILTWPYSGKSNPAVLTCKTHLMCITSLRAKLAQPPNYGGTVPQC